MTQHYDFSGWQYYQIQSAVGDFLPNRALVQVAISHVHAFFVCFQVIR